MLAHLARYLRAALPRMRDHDVSLADEIELVSAFLGVQKIRMGARLASSIDVPAPLLEARAPSMMLATLVENAIKHGIGPLARRRDPGRGRREDETLVLSVADTGHGFAAASGSGVGLSNIRARLARNTGSGRPSSSRPTRRAASSLPSDCRGPAATNDHEQRASPSRASSGGRRAADGSAGSQAPPVHRSRFLRRGSVSGITVQARGGTASHSGAWSARSSRVL